MNSDNDMSTSHHSVVAPPSPVSPASTPNAVQNPVVMHILYALHTVAWASMGTLAVIARILYALHTVAWASMGTLAVIALIVNYIARSDETDALYREHHSYMITTFWWTLGLCLLTSPLFIFMLMPGVFAWTVIGFWYLYRCIKGWLRFNKNRMPS
jgi:uncharacterized membrane protein